MHLRGGSIIPFQNAEGNNVTRSHHLFNITKALYINPDHEFKANGSIIFDDGITEEFAGKKYINVDIKLDIDRITFNATTIFDDYYNNDIVLNSIKILRGKRWSEYKNIETKNLKGDIIAVSGKDLDKEKDIFVLSFTDKIKFNELQSISFLN